MSYIFVLNYAGKLHVDDINMVDDVNDVGNKILRKAIPGIGEIFGDVQFVYDPMTKRISITEELTVETDDDRLYNRLFLQNPNIKTYTDDRKLITSYGNTFYMLEIHKVD